MVGVWRALALQRRGHKVTLYDTAGAYEMSPMAKGMRLSKVLRHRAQDATPDLVQLQLAERRAGRLSHRTPRPPTGLARQAAHVAR